MQVLAHMTGMGLQARRRRIQQLGDDICLGWLELQDRREEIMRHHHNLHSSRDLAKRQDGMNDGMAWTQRWQGPGPPAPIAVQSHSLRHSPPLAADGIERLGDWLGQPLRGRDSRWHGLQAVVGVFSSLVMTCFCMDLT